METYKIHLKLVRSFGLGFTVLSPKWNGFCVSVRIACFELCIWSRGKRLATFTSYWKAYL
jgi:hypothetical protein